MIDAQYEKHKHCTLTIRYKEFANKPKPVAGLFCKTHNEFIDWLSPRMAKQVLAMGVAVEPWQPTARQIQKEKTTQWQKENRLKNLQKKQRKQKLKAASVDMN
jgi:hypothetical protein